MASVELPVTYRCEIDPAAYQRASLAHMRQRWLEWLNYGTRTGLSYAVCGFLAYGIAAHHAGSQSLTGLVATMLFCFAVGLGTPLLEYLDCATSLQRFMVPEAPWDCTLTEQGWGSTDQRGVSQFIPWKVMVPRLGHRDAWVVHYGTMVLFVFREPLRQNGLDEIFRELAGFKAP